MNFRGVFHILLSINILACEVNNTPPIHSEYELANPQIWQELGRHLFYDRRLSVHENRSCGICHEQAKGFTDGFVRAVGATEEVHPRNTLTLINVSTRTSLGWISPEPEHLETQLLIPLLGIMPVEMGLDGLLIERMADLNQDPIYKDFISELELDRLTLEDLATAIACFERAITSYRSPYDDYLAGQDHALSLAAQRGLILFNEELDCQQCHGGKDFDQPKSSYLDSTASKAATRHGWFNTGLYNLSDSRYPHGREGLFEVTGLDDDIGKYRVPTLRNLSFTSPYYHDGSGASLDDVLQNYNTGGRVIESGPYIGDGRQHPNKHPLIRKLELLPKEIEDLKAFLLSLNDEHIVTDPRFSDPWQRKGE